MPYSNIVFIKVQMELFEDDRFLIDLNDTQKGLYLMLLVLAGKTNNRIRNDINFIKVRLNITNASENDLMRINEVYPKFRLKEGYWGFENFEKIHNYTIQNKNEANEGTPKEFLGIAQNKNKKKKENKNILKKEAFEVFWGAYPKKVAKQDAINAFTKLNPDETLLKAMLLSLGGVKNSPDWLKDGGKYVPYPATWINGRRWEDVGVKSVSTDNYAKFEVD